MRRVQVKGNEYRDRDDKTDKESGTQCATPRCSAGPYSVKSSLSLATDSVRRRTKPGLRVRPLTAGGYASLALWMTGATTYHEPRCTNQRADAAPDAG